MRLLGVGVSVVVGALAFFSPSPEARQAAAQGRALTIEDYYRIQSVGNPSMSPNGQWVAFTVSTRSEAQENGGPSSAWLVPAEVSWARSCSRSPVDRW